MCKPDDEELKVCDYHGKQQENADDVGSKKDADGPEEGTTPDKPCTHEHEANLMSIFKLTNNGQFLLYYWT